MNTYQEAYALVASLYDSGDLSHDQANPILAALEAAGELEETVKVLLILLKRDLVWAETQPYRALIYKQIRAAYATLGLPTPARYNDATEQTGNAEVVQDAIPQDAAASVSSSIAAMIIKKRLEAGGTVEIPSLGITFTKDDLKGET